jgi:hypothetical protein
MRWRLQDMKIATTEQVVAADERYKKKYIFSR